MTNMTTMTKTILMLDKEVGNYDDDDDDDDDDDNDLYDDSDDEYADMPGTSRIK